MGDVTQTQIRINGSLIPELTHFEFEVVNENLKMHTWRQ